MLIYLKHPQLSNTKLVTDALFYLHQNPYRCQSDRITAFNCICVNAFACVHSDCTEKQPMQMIVYTCILIYGILSNRILFVWALTR